MADNVTFTTPSFAAATDEVTGTLEHVQLMKLAISTDGSRTLIPADGTDGLLVNLGANNDVAATLAAGTAYVGKVRQTDGTNDISLSTSFADATSNTTTALPTRSFSMAFNGTTWDRLRVSSAFADGESNSQIALLTEAYCTMFNGTTWDRMRGDTTSGLWVNVKADATDAPSSTINSTSSDGGTALTSTAQAIKASAGTLNGYFIYNPNATVAYVQFYNTAQGSVTVGTTNPLFMLTIPPASAANLWMHPGVTFSTAMSWSATSTAGGNGAPSTALDAVCWYT